ncbi:MAG: hypothetical protein RDV48_13715 [Candidatus Eremiobacteraeota bacterium]|nr:hypothetical protein [Candidatus Eremiobacteraeota bacterium]
MRAQKADMDRTVMKKSLHWIILLLILSPTLCLCATSQEEELWSKACEYYGASVTLEKTSYRAALESYEKALTALEEIVTSFPDSPTARQLQSGERKLGKLTYQEFRSSLLPRARLRAEAEEDPVACAILIWEKTKRNEFYGAILASEAYAKRGQPDKAIAYAETEANVHLREDAFIEVTRACAEKGDIEGAKRALKKLQELEKADESGGFVYKLIRAIVWLDSALVKAGRVNEVSSVLSQAVAQGNDCSKVYEVGAKAYLEAGIYEKAFECALEIPDPETRSETLCELSRQMIKVSDSEMALRYAGLISEPSNRAKAYASLVKFYLARDEDVQLPLDEALKSAQLIKDPYERIDRLCEIAESLAKAGHKEQALEALEYVKQAVSAMNKGTKRLIPGVYYLLPGYLLLNRKDLARSALMEYLNGKYALPDKKDRTRVAAHGFAIIGDYKKACSYAGNDGQLMTYIAESAAKAGCYDDAFRIAGMIKDEQYRHSAETALHAIQAHHYRKLGNSGKSQEALRKAVAAAHSIKKSWLLDSTMTGLANWFEQKGDIEEWKVIVEKISWYNQRSNLQYLQYWIIRHYLESGEVEKAHQKAAMIKGGLLSMLIRSQAFEETSVGYAKRGDWERALEVAGEIDDDWSRVVALCTIAPYCREPLTERGKNALHRIIEKLEQ